MSTKATGQYGPFNRAVPFKRWWCWLWGVVAVGLIVSVWFRTPFMVWTLAVVCTFGVMETIGVFCLDEGYPPLTQVIVEYVPRWLAFSLIYACTGLAGGTWFHFRERVELALLTSLLGWFTTHFDTAFDGTLMRRENVKYAWYARRLGMRVTSERIAARDESRARRQQDAL